MTVLCDAGVPRTTALLAAFVRAGGRGLTEHEMQEVAGACWRLRLRDLRDVGYAFREVPSRFGARTFRWVLIAGPVVERQPEAVEQPVLFVPPPAPPGDAIAGES